MTKRPSVPPSANDKAKVRVLFAEVEGNNDSIQEALRTMVSAMSRPVRIISDSRSGPSTPMLAQEEEEPHVEEEVGITLDEAVDIAPARKTRGSGKKVDRNASLTLIPDLNFRPKGEETLRDFFAKKSPDSDVTSVVVLVYYMQHIMKLDKISASHVMTAFKEVGKQIPVDLKQTIRNIKGSKMWINFTDIDDLKTTTQGENAVEHDMGKEKNE